MLLRRMASGIANKAALKAIIHFETTIKWNNWKRP